MEIQEQLRVSFQMSSNLPLVSEAEDSGLRCVMWYPWLESTSTSTSLVSKSFIKFLSCRHHLY